MWGYSVMASRTPRPFTDPFQLIRGRLLESATPVAADEVIIRTNVSGSPQFARSTLSAIQTLFGAGTELADDTSPQLGGNLDVTGYKIVTTSNGNIDIEPNGTGNVLIGNFTFNADQSVGSGQDNYVLTYDHSTGTIGLETPAAAGLNNVIEDTSPQLGGQLDVNGQAIGDGTRELLTFTEDASAVNHINIENQATGSGPILRATGDDAAVDLVLGVKGSGQIKTESGVNINLEDKQLIRPNLKDWGEITNALGDLGGGTDDIDITAGNVISATVSTATQTFTFSNPTASDEGCGFTLVLTNGGSQTVNWPGSVLWEGGTAPTLTASGVDVLEFFTINGGTTWYGFSAGLDMS